MRNCSVNQLFLNLSVSLLAGWFHAPITEAQNIKDDQLTVTVADPGEASSPFQSQFGNLNAEQGKEFAYFIRQKNLKSDLPELEYWGVRNLYWGMPEEATAQILRSFPTVIFDLSFSWDLDFSEGQLIAAKRIFAGQLDTKIDKSELREKRKSRLEKFVALQAGLEATFGSPTHGYASPPNPTELDNDLYVRSGIMQYRIEWHGSQSILSLRLSDNELVMENMKAPGSQGEAKELAAEQWEGKLEEMKSEQIKQSLPVETGDGSGVENKKGSDLGSTQDEGPQG